MADPADAPPAGRPEPEPEPSPASGHRPLRAARSGPSRDRALVARLLGQPSAALVMGTMAGTLSAITFVPTAIPLILQIVQAEETLGQTHTRAAAFAIAASLPSRGEPTESLMASQLLDHLTVRADDQEWTFGEPLPWTLLAPTCAASEGSAVVQASPRQFWALSCVNQADVTVVTAVHLDPQGPAQRVLLLVVMLALFVGVVTSLGILRLMRPLTAISIALQRVGAGERGVTVARTGLAELDGLVDRLNAAARSVDDREDTIVSRIELVQEMARMVAHEVRNPLQSLELLTSLVVSEEDREERRVIGESIHSEIRTLEQVVNRLLRESAAKGSLRLQMTRQAVAPLVEQVVALRRPQASQQGIRLTTGPLSYTEVEFDQPLVKRSIENLVLNALQAVERGFGDVRISVVDDRDQVQIVVEDNGPGVAPELIDHIFEPNVSGRPGGTGLGLALVKGVIEAHNGYIRYGRSALGGARFEARLPLNPDKAKRQVAPALAAGPRSGEGREPG